MKTDPPASSRFRPALSVALVAVSVALGAGLLEAAILYTRRLMFHHFTWVTPHILWMAPVGNLAWIAVPALLAAGVAALRPRWMPLPVVTAVLVLVVSGGLLLVASNGALHPATIGLLAAGAAIQAARGVIARPAVCGRWLCRITPVLLLLTALLAVGMPLGQRWLESRAIRAATATRSAPDVLLIILDTVRGASLSLYGNPRPTTPHISDYGKEGAVFDQAYSPAPWTLPSHASMFTGHWPHDLSTGWVTPLDNRWPTLAERMREAGYVTAAFTANWSYTSRESGLARGFMHYDDMPVDVRQTLRAGLLGQVVEQLVKRHQYEFFPVRSTHRKSAGEVRKAFEKWLPTTGGRPYFAFLNLYDAHRPYQPPAGFRDSLTAERRPVDRYEQLILYLDHEIDQLLRHLAREGRLDHTIVVVASDHGELFGEHDLNGHSQALYGRLIHVPLVIRYPGRVPAGFRTAAPVSLRNLAATILDLAGLADSVIPGTSLAGAWTGRAMPDTVFAEVQLNTDKPESPAGKGPMQAVIAGDLHYIREADGTERLYHLRGDSLQVNDLVDSAGYSAPVSALRAARANWLGDTAVGTTVTR